MPTCHFLLTNALVLTVDDRLTVYTPGVVAVSGDSIVPVGADAEGWQAGKVVDCRGRVLMPGLVNRAEMMELATTCMRAIRQAYHPQGFNLGANIGEAAGAGVADHVHLHIVPRWTGDTNYMTTLGNVRVLPEELEDTYHRLLEAWKQVA